LYTDNTQKTYLGLFCVPVENKSLVLFYRFILFLREPTFRSRIIYELGKDETHSVQNVITYIYGGPLEGLPYDEVIQLLQKNSHVNDLSAIIRELIDNLSYDLVALAIDNHKLNNIKQLFNQLAMFYCFGNIGNMQLDQAPDASAPLNTAGSILDRISLNIMSLVIHFKKASQNNAALVTVTNMPTDNSELIARYAKLGFAQNNYWTYLLSKNSFTADSIVQPENQLQPIKLQLEEVYAFISIMNPELDEVQKKELIKELFIQRNWKIPSAVV
jgi:hypothetical protein